MRRSFNIKFIYATLAFIFILFLFIYCGDNASNSSPTNTVASTTTAAVECPIFKSYNNYTMQSGEDCLTPISLNFDQRVVHSTGSVQKWLFEGTHGASLSDYEYSCQGKSFIYGVDVYFEWIAPSDGFIVAGDCGLSNSFNSMVVLLDGATDCSSNNFCDASVYCLTEMSGGSTHTSGEINYPVVACQKYLLCLKKIDVNPLPDTFQFRLEFTPKPSKYKWLVMIYADGDNNLESDLKDEINQIEAAGGDSQSIKYVVLYDRLGTNDTSRYDGLSYDPERVNGTNSWAPGDGTTIISEETWTGEVDMGTSSTLANFGQTAISSFPAEHYMLIIMDHGSGWMKKKSLPKVGLPRGVCSDDTSGNMIFIYNHAFQSAIQAIASGISGGKIDMVFLDVCETQMIETAWEIKDYVKSVVGSEAISWGGQSKMFHWSYLMRRNAGYDEWANYSTIANAIGDAYKYYWINFWSSYNYYPSTLSGIDLILFNSNVVPKFTSFAQECYNVRSNPTYTGYITTCKNNAMDYSFTSDGYDASISFVDVKDMCDKISAYSALPTSLKTAAAELSTELSNATIFSYFGSGIDPNTSVSHNYNPSYGLSIETKDKAVMFYSPYYDMLDISTQTQWGNFIDYVW